jgi:type I restriction enzyme, S subunit
MRNVDQMGAAELESFELGEIAHVEMGQSPESRFVFEDPFIGYPFLQGNAEFGQVFPAPKYGCLRPTKLCRTNDVLISVRAPVGAVNLADRDYCIGRGLAAIRARGIKPSLIGEVISRQSAALRRVAQGTTFEAINKNDLLSLPLKLPPRRQWLKIAEILDTLDTAIHETEAIIAKLTAVKRGLLHDLLTRGISANGELRPPQSEAPHLYKPSPLGWVPRAWEVKTVSEVADVSSGSTPSREQANRYFAALGIPWVKTLDLNEDFIRATVECVTATALRETSCSLLPEGTVLVAMYGGWEQIGRTAMLAVPAATNQAISALLFRSSSTVPEFVLRALQHGRPRWHKVAASTRKDPNITKADVLAFEVPVPAPDEQIEIARRLRTCLDRLEFDGSTLAKLRHQKAGLMDDLLSGRVRVTTLLAEAEQQKEHA